MSSNYRTKIAHLYMMLDLYGTGMDNASAIDDPVVNEYFPKVQTAFITDIAEANRLYREVMKHVLGQVYCIPRVAPYTYVIWWPWLKNYSGEIEVAYYFFQWVWLDQELKKSMGY